MQATNCPICFSPLESREVAACMDCGHDPQELQHFRDGKHTYAEYRIFDDLSLVLCDFCHADFSSYDPTYFGLPSKTSIGLGFTTPLRDVSPPGHTFDKVCTQCQHRLAFLEFVSAARSFHEAHRNI